MLSYRHSFHAGNHADVLKHITLSLVLRYMQNKDKPLIYIDTHAGRGSYNLSCKEAQKTGEFHDGIEKLLNNKQIKTLIPDYYQCIKQLNSFDKSSEKQSISPQIKFYPGSPLIAQMLLRSNDKMILMELHNNEVIDLKKIICKKNDLRVTIHHRDGFEGLIAITPPAIKRGVILIDPSYEIIDDYKKVVDTVAVVLKKWSNVTILVWYPHLLGSKNHTLFMHEKVRKISCKEILDVSMCIYEPQNENATGMYGSGIIIFNPTFGLKDQLQQILQLIHPLLKKSEKADFHVTQIM